MVVHPDKETAPDAFPLFLQHDELRENEATTQEHLHTIKDAIEAAAKK